MNKKIIFFALLLLAFTIYDPPSTISVAHAQDTPPNTNVTKRRPDRPANYSPTPVPSPTIQPAEVKQVEAATPSFFVRLWNNLKFFFQNLFK